MVDSVAGAVVSAAAVLLVAWMVASPLASSPFPGVASQVRQSALVQAVDRAVPDSVRSVYDNLREAIDRRGLPDVLDPLTPTQVRDVAAARPGAVDSPVVAKVKGSVVQGQRHRAVLLAADRRLRVRLRPERVMTNAHVLAGVGQPRGARGGRASTTRCRSTWTRRSTSPCSTCPGLPEVPLPFAPQPAATGADSIIMGFPGGGGRSTSGPPACATAGDQRAGLPQHAHRPRDVYALYGIVRAGNSGGPLFATEGSVLGVVFASAIDDPNTGYALTALQVGDAARPARRRPPRSPPAPVNRGPLRGPPRAARGGGKAGPSLQSAIAALTTSGASSWGKWPMPGSSRHS